MSGTTSRWSRESGQAEARRAAAGGVDRGTHHMARGGRHARPRGDRERARSDQGLTASPRHHRGRTPGSVRPATGLASESPSFLTGEIVVLDGGRTARSCRCRR